MACFGVADDEVAEAEASPHGLAQVLLIGLAVFADEVGFELLGELARAFFVAFVDDGQVFVVSSDVFAEFVACFGIFLAVHGETHVAHDAQDAVFVEFVEAYGFFVCSGEHHLGPPAHSHGFELFVEGFAGEKLALFEYVAEEMGERATIETHAVFDEQDDLHAHAGAVVRGVPFVFYKFDDGYEQLCFAEP